MRFVRQYICFFPTDGELYLFNIRLLLFLATYGNITPHTPTFTIINDSTNMFVSDVLVLKYLPHFINSALLYHNDVRRYIIHTMV